MKLGCAMRYINNIFYVFETLYGQQHDVHSTSINTVTFCFYKTLIFGMFFSQNEWLIAVDNKVWTIYINTAANKKGTGI